MRKILLTGMHGVGKYVLVDDADYDLVSNWAWNLNTGGYAVCHRGAMHRLIMGTPPAEGLHADHKDRDRLNNQRHNLRWVSPQQNSQNSEGYGASEYKGVKKDGGRWAARIQGLHLGSFKTEVEAAMVYDRAARYFFGEFAFLNFGSVNYNSPVRFVDFHPEPVKRKSKYIGVSLFGDGSRAKPWRAVFRKNI